MSDDNDLIRRGDAEKAMLPFVHNVIADDAIAAIRDLPAANAECGDVSSAEIAIVRDEVKNRFGVGEGKLTVIAEPAAPTFTAADLERAWEMGRDTLGSLLDHHPIYVSALAPPPADLAQRVKE